MDQLSFQLAAEYDGTTVATDTTREYYVWQPSGGLFTINLDLSVVDKLHTEVMRGFGAVRRRGTEVGGILLGRIDLVGDHVTVTVEDFQPVACEYAHGPSYILSGDDLQNFRKALAEFDPSAGKPVYTVGFYRSNTRDGLTLDEIDVKFFREYFPDPLHIVLLIKPFASKAPVAGFFLQDRGVLNAKSAVEFPFRRRDLTGQPDPERPDERPHVPSNGSQYSSGKPSSTMPDEPPASTTYERPAPVVIPRHDEVRDEAARDKPMFAAYEHRPSAWRNRLGWLAMCIMLVVFGVVIGTQYTGGGGAPSTVSSAADPYALNLAVSRVDDNLLVKWDPKSLAVKGGWRGVLTITEGTDSKNVQMEPPKLQNGSVLYRHVAPEVTFRLEVFVKEHRSVVETTTYQMSPGSSGSSQP
jgi:hypothetical protein